MDSILKAIESRNGTDPNPLSTMVEELEKSTAHEPVLSFVSRPPQWCIVDKWFTMQVASSDPTLKELEACVYNSDGHILTDLLQSDVGEKEGRKLVAQVDNSHKATFRLKFVNGSKGAWLNIGVHSLKQPDKCLLKSPPIKVQTNRSKRPRDNKKKPVPSVTSLSPNVVPSYGNFPGRKDRMVLIFGSNFYLWGNSPVVRLIFSNNTYKTPIEIRPPNLIWWSDNLLECQLPECDQDIEVKVANYEMAFGEGKVLKILNTASQSTEDDSQNNSPNSRQPYPTIPITNGRVVLDYQVNEKVDILEASLRVLTQPSEDNKILVESFSGSDRIDPNDLTALIKIYNKITEDVLQEMPVRPAAPDPNQMDQVTYKFNLSIPVKLIADASEPYFIATFLKNERTGQLLVDPFSKQTILSEKQIFVSQDDDDYPSSQSDSPISNGSSYQYSSAFTEDIPTTKAFIHNFINKCEDIDKLLQWEGVLDEALTQLRARKIAISKIHPISHPNSHTQLFTKDAHQSQGNQLSTQLYPQPIKQEEFAPTPQSSRMSLRAEPEEEDDEESDEEEPQQKRGKLVASSHGSKQEITLAIKDPNQKNGVVYWKFFNPGNRTFLELIDGKLQIIGSRRIQMLIESVPPGSKFISAHLYIQKNDSYDSIEHCQRCKENGIPNIFCVLPRRGREHDFPWITFRITCTSTAKHWKGTLFWIGAEYLLDPIQGTIAKYFSPPIHVQSKVKSKDLERTSSKTLDLRSSTESMPNTNILPPQLTTSLTPPAPIHPAITAASLAANHLPTISLNTPSAPASVTSNTPAAITPPPANTVSNSNNISSAVSPSPAVPISMPPPSPITATVSVFTPPIGNTITANTSSPLSALNPTTFPAQNSVSLNNIVTLSPSPPSNPSKTVSLVQSSGSSPLFTHLRTSNS